MRELFEDGLGPSPLDPHESARQHARPSLRKRFYSRVDVSEMPTGEGFAVVLDGRPLRTPAKHPLAAPQRAIAEAIAAEWNAQTDVIDPASMPLTRLANSIIDGVAEQMQAVAEEIVKYLGTDLLFYRADAPERLVARQNEHWNPVLDWAASVHGARFILSEGIVHVEQSKAVIDAMRATLPADAWRLGALHVVTSLTGSALIALALAQGALTSEAAWTAANIDEDWNTEIWGSDAEVIARREFRRRDFDAAAFVLGAAH